MTSFLPLQLGSLGSASAERPCALELPIRREPAPLTSGDVPLADSGRLLEMMRALGARLSALDRQEAMDDDLTAAQRTLLVDLARRGPVTLPQLARTKSVSRQQVRVVVEALARRGLVRRLSNRAHRRSFLVGVTAAGSGKAREIARGESLRLEKIERTLGTKGVRDGTVALRAVLDALDESPEI